MPRNKKYAKAPKNLGKSSIESSVITKEIKLETNPSKIAQFYSDNKNMVKKYQMKKKQNSRVMILGNYFLSQKKSLMKLQISFLPDLMCTRMVF